MMPDLYLPAGRLSVLCLAAHPDDVEIGCGGTLLELIAARPETRLRFVTLTGSDERQQEALAAAEAFAPGSTSRFGGLPDGRLPAHWAQVKQLLEDVAAEDGPPDLIFAPRRDDAHQDHRLISELVPTVWRNALVMEYEIPKWDGDLGPVSTYVAIPEATARRKFDLLDRVYLSQLGRDWWSEDTFLSLMRLRGIECRTRYAEGFVVRKQRLSWSVPS